MANRGRPARCLLCCLLGLPASGAPADQYISVPESRIYRVADLTALMSAGGAERVADHPYRGDSLYVSGGRYAIAELDDAIAAATGLRWRSVGPLKVLVAHDFVPFEPAKHPGWLRLLRALQPRARAAAAPFGLATADPLVSEKQELTFNDLSKEQQIWLAARVRRLPSPQSVGGQEAPVSYDELAASRISWHTGVVLYFDWLLPIAREGDRTLFWSQSKLSSQLPVDIWPVSPADER